MNNEDKIARKMKEIMELLNIPVDSNSKGTPHRLAKMWQKELFSSLNVNVEDFKKTLTIFPAPSSLQPISVKDIPFHSTCAHHWLPFFGKAKVRYIPSCTIIGLSKIPRVVDFCAKKPQVQEYLTNDIGELLVDVLKPLKLEVVLYDVVHTCVTCRGVENFAQTDTNYVYTDEEFYDGLMQENSW